MGNIENAPGIRNELIGALPIIKFYTDRLRIVEMVDRIIPKAPQSPVSHGECVLAMLISVLQSDHRLCYVEQKLRDVDLTSFFGRPGIEANHFNDTRLGVALDALYSHTREIYGNIICAAIVEFGIHTKRLHVDTTTVILRGVYDILEVLPALREPPPNPARGHSKEHRPDLLQLMFGMVNTNEGIPVMGRFENGNGADSKLFRNYMAELAGRLDDLRATDAVMVGDSKLCTIPTLVQAAELGFPLITMLPDTFAWRKEFVGKAALDKDLPLLLTTADGETYHGKSWRFPTILEVPGKEPRTVWLRCLAVHSSQLAEKRKAGRQREVAKERDALEEMVGKLRTNPFACEADAKKMAHRDWKAMKPRFHDMRLEVFQEEVDIAPRKPGRPPKNPPPPVLTMVWRAIIHIEDQPRQETPFDTDGFFVLVTSVTDRRRSDAQLLEAYKGQQVVETSFKWMKGPLATDPLHLKLPTRIQALGFVLLLALLFSSLLQRDARRAMKNRDGKVPNFPGRRSTSPTWQGIVALFEGVRLTTVIMGRQVHRAFHLLEADQMEILTLLGIPKIYETYSNVVYD
jgi:transposase